MTSLRGESTIRIGDIVLKKMVDKSDWEVLCMQMNPYFGHADDYEWSEDGEEAYPKNEDGTLNKHHRVHKSCFVHRETAYTLAFFRYHPKDDYYQLEFCDTRPFFLEDDKWEDFIKLIRLSNKILCE